MTDSGYQIDLVMSWIVIMLIKLILRCALKLCTDTNHHIGSNWGTEAFVRLKCMRCVYYAPTTEDRSSSLTIFGRSDSNADSVTWPGGTCCRDVTAAGRALRVNYIYAPPRRAASTFSSCAASSHRRANSAGELEVVRGAAAAATFIFIKESQLLVFRVLVGCTHPVFTRSSSCQNIASLSCKPPVSRLNNNRDSKT